jgi:hypothetical protein
MNSPEILKIRRKRQPLMPGFPVGSVAENPNGTAIAKSSVRAAPASFVLDVESVCGEG